MYILNPISGNMFRHVLNGCVALSTVSHIFPQGFDQQGK